MRHVAYRLVLLAFLPLAGCGSTTTNNGHYISDATVAQLVPGKIDADWVLLVLGEPDERRIGPGESETWVWHNRRTRREQGRDRHYSHLPTAPEPFRTQVARLRRSLPC